MIHYCCPDFLPFASSGLRFLYKHVAILNRHGHQAAILHQTPGYRLTDVPEVPIGYMSVGGTLSSGDIVVVPEIGTELMRAMSGQPFKLVAIALNWKHIFRCRHKLRTEDWRSLGVRHVLVNSPVIGEMIEWTMQLPWHLTTMGINPALYYDAPQEKFPQISYIARKGRDIQELQDVLYSRNPKWIEKIAWKALEGLSEAQYAKEIRRSQVYVNVSHAEGFPISLCEAMRAATLVAGYNSVGGRRELVGDGPEQNCILSENLDTVSLAMRLETLLDDMLQRDLSRWSPVIQNGLALSREFTVEREEATACEAWSKVLADL